MYYIIEQQYAGPSPHENADADHVTIMEEPARGNAGDHPVILQGWCGTNSEWATYAHGEYPTLEAALDAIRPLFGAVREIDGYPDEVARFALGEHAPMNRSGVADWIYPSMREDITATTTNAELAELADTYEWAARGEGYTCGGYLPKILEAYRDEIQEEAE